MEGHAVNQKIIDLLHRFRNLVQVLEGLLTTIQQIGPIGKVRYKPIYSDYISCISEFKDLFPDEYAKLNLETITLYDENDKELFTGGKLSTLLHQSKSVLALLASRAPSAEELQLPDKVTLAWLWKHVPAKFWLWLLGIMVFVLGVGITIGQVDWIKEIVGIDIKKEKYVKGLQTITKRPKIGIFHNGKESSDQKLSVQGQKNKSFDKYYVLKDFYIKNIGNEASGDISINVYMSEKLKDEAEVDQNFMAGGTWSEVPSTDEEYIYSAKLQRTVRLNRGESYTIPSFGFMLEENHKLSFLNGKIEIYYRGEDPSKTFFVYYLQ